jgi:peptidylprolyl isomerase
MRKALYPAALALLLTVAASPAGAADVIARLGTTDITTDDVRAYVETLPPADQAAVAKDPALLSQVVRAYLANRLVLKEAKDAKFDQQPATKAQLDRVKDAALSELYLQAVVKVPDPTEAEIQSAYDANKSAFLLPRQYRLAQIFIVAPKGDKAAEDQAKPKLDDVVKKLKGKGADFAAIAQEQSDEKESGAKGGEIGWLAEPQIAPDIRQAVAGLTKDGISDPVRMDDGWHILKLLDTKPAGTAALADVRERLVAQLRQKRGQALRQAYLGKLMEKSPPAINELALGKVLASAGK